MARGPQKTTRLVRGGPLVTIILSNRTITTHNNGQYKTHYRYSRKSKTFVLNETNYPDKVVCSGVFHVNISDHSLVFVYRKLSIGALSKRHNTINYRTFKNFNPDHFRNDIASQNWDVLDNFQDPDDMWREWKIKFLNVVNTHTPPRTKRVRSKRSPWITSELEKTYP